VRYSFWVRNDTSDQRQFKQFWDSGCDMSSHRFRTVATSSGFYKRKTPSNIDCSQQTNVAGLEVFSLQMLMLEAFLAVPRFFKILWRGRNELSRLG